MEIATSANELRLLAEVGGLDLRDFLEESHAAGRFCNLLRTSGGWTILNPDGRFETVVGDGIVECEEGLSNAVNAVGCCHVTIPEGVTSIGDFAFFGCSGLTSMTMPDIVTSIGKGAFYNCSGLTGVTMSDSVNTIGASAFRNCSGLTSVTIPEGVTSIGDFAFEGCSNLANVTIPDSVTSIGDWAFKCCSKLASFTVGNGNANYKSVNGLLLSKDGKTLIAGVSGDVTIPDSVTGIRESAFEGRSGLNSVTIGSGVTTIGYLAFSGCSGLTSVTMPDSVTIIGEHAFSGCSGLTSVTIPNSVASIGIYVFDSCDKLTNVRFCGRNAAEVRDMSFYPWGLDPDAIKTDPASTV